MNHIAQILNCTLVNKSRTPTSSERLSRNESTPEGQTRRGPWRSAVLSKVKECRDAIKGIITFDRTPRTNELPKASNIARTHLNVSPSVNPRLTFSTSMPDIVRSSKLSACKSTEETSTTRDSELESEESDYRLCKRKIRVSLGRSYDESNKNDSSSYFPMDVTDSSLMSFVALEKRIQEESLEAKRLEECVDENTETDSTTSFSNVRSTSGPRDIDHVRHGNAQDSSPDIYAFSIKKKISAEPFISYKEGRAELFWAEDLDDSNAEKGWNSSECLNSADITFDTPCQNSTFCEDTKDDKRAPLPTPSPTLQDSGFENNLSIMRETI